MTGEIMKRKAVVIFSGGLDSTTLLFWVQRAGFLAFPITFLYGQKHKKEVECARRICDKLGLTHEVVDLTVLQKLLKSALTSQEQDIPEGRYTKERQQQTMVPMRNAIFINIAAGYAMSIGACRVFYAAHWNDSCIYPDCREEFVDAQNCTVKLATGKTDLVIVAPFIRKTKEQIVKLGKSLGVPFEDTWSCYKGNEKACGKCGTCIERLQAFKANNLKDPIEYEVIT